MFLYDFDPLWAKRLLLISQGLASFQGVRDPLLRLLFPAKRNEGFALKIENILLADHLRCGQRSASENVGQLAADVRVVFRSACSAPPHVDRQFRPCKELFSKHFTLSRLVPF